MRVGSTSPFGSIDQSVNIYYTTLKVDHIVLPVIYLHILFFYLHIYAMLNDTSDPPLRARASILC